MKTRRNFISTAAATAGMVFCSCGLQGTARAAARLPFALGGKRVKTIDVHSHCLFHESLDLMGPETVAMVVPPLNGQDEIWLAVDQRLKAMDAQAVDLEVLSVNPFWYGKDRELGEKIVSINNDKLAAIVAAHPDRFAAFCCLTLQAPDLAVMQLEKAMKAGFKGAAIGDRVNDWEFSDPALHPVWAKAEELDATLFIHPQGIPELTKRLKGNGWLWNTIANPLSTTIALQHIIFEGTLDRFPKLKFLAAHGGGYLPPYADRDDHACFVGPAFCDPKVGLKKRPTEYLKQLYFDALIFTPEALQRLVAQVGVSQIMMGSDYPYPWELHPVDHILSAETLTDEEKIAILSGNAQRALGIKV